MDAFRLHYSCALACPKGLWQEFGTPYHTNNTCRSGCIIMSSSLSSGSRTTCACRSIHPRANGRRAAAKGAGRSVSIVLVQARCLFLTGNQWGRVQSCPLFFPPRNPSMRFRDTTIYQHLHALRHPKPALGGEGLWILSKDFLLWASRQCPPEKSPTDLGLQGGRKSEVIGIKVTRAIIRM